MTSGLRLELFVDDVERSLSFYADVLGFEANGGGVGDHRRLRRGLVRVAVNRRASLPDGHPLAAPGPPGLGVELVLEVDDLAAVHDHVRHRWPIAAELADQPWGQRDFRVLDPDGYYWRLTTPPTP